jgi:hypothetical protein
MTDDSKGPTAYAVARQIEDDLPSETEYPRVGLEVSVMYNREQEEVEYLVTYAGEDSSNKEVLTDNIAILKHRGMSSDEVVDFLGGTLDDKIVDDVNIVLNGQYVQGEPSADYSQTGEWNSESI